MQHDTSFHARDVQFQDFALNSDQPAGLTLLDYFAATALNGILASTHNCSPQVCARLAYEHAAAMMEARSRMLSSQSTEHLRQVAQVS